MRRFPHLSRGLASPAAGYFADRAKSRGPWASVAKPDGHRHGSPSDRDGLICPWTRPACARVRLRACIERLGPGSPHERLSRLLEAVRRGHRVRDQPPLACRTVPPARRGRVRSAARWRGHAIHPGCLLIGRPAHVPALRQTGEQVRDAHRRMGRPPTPRGPSSLDLTPSDRSRSSMWPRGPPHRISGWPRRCGPGLGLGGLGGVGKRARGHRAASPRRGIAAVSRWSISGRLHSGRRGRPARKGSHTVRVSAPGSVQLTVTVHAWALVFCRSLSYGVWPPSPP